MLPATVRLEKPLMDWDSPLLVLACALGCGMLIGIERGWSLRNEEPGNRVAGVRTFSLLGLAGGIAGLATRHGAAWLGGALAIVVTRPPRYQRCW
jgi:uncharacterized membrane protein YhiD involved in acid resistance